MIAARTLLSIGTVRDHHESITILQSALAGALVSTARIVAEAEARWVGCAPTGAKRIYFANHTSHADFVLIWAALPQSLRWCTRPVAAADYWARGTVRRYLAGQIFGAVLVKRGYPGHEHAPLTPLLEALDYGHSLIVFPEGTRGSGDALAPFKCGIYRLALARPEVELVPVWIDNLYRVLPRGAILPAPLRCSVTFGEATRLLSGESKKVFLTRLQGMVASLGESCKVNCS